MEVTSSRKDYQTGHSSGRHVEPGRECLIQWMAEISLSSIVERH